MAPLILTGSIGGLGVLKAVTVTWTDGSGNGLWDTTSTNWITGATATTYQDGEDVVFTDAGAGTVTIASGPNPVGDPANTGLAPKSVLVNSSLDYTLGGTTAQNGGDPLIDPVGSALKITKQGTGTLTLTGQNTFTGGVDVKQGTLVTPDIFGTLGNGNIGTGTLTLGDAGLNTAATLVDTGTANSNQVVFNSVALAGQGGAIKTDRTLDFSNGSVLTGSAPLTVDKQSAGGGTVIFRDASAFTGSINIVNGAVEVDKIGLGAAGKTITLPASGTQVDAGNAPIPTFIYGGASDAGSLTNPDRRQLVVPALGGVISNSGTFNYYLGGGYSDQNVSTSVLTEAGTGGFIFTGPVTFHQIPVLTAGGGLLGFTNTSTVAGSANVFPTGGVFQVSAGATLLTHINSLGNATFQLNGGTIALVGENPAAGSAFGYNVPVTATNSGISYTNGTEATLGALSLPFLMTFNASNGAASPTSTVRMTLASTSFGTAENYTFNVNGSADLGLGTVVGQTSGGSSTTITKVGDGALSFDNNKTVTNLASLDILQGAVQVVTQSGGGNPLASTAIAFDNNGNGVVPTLVLSSSGGNVSYTPNLAINSSATFSASKTAFGGSVDGTAALPITVTLNASPVITAGNILTLQSSPNYILSLNGPISGGGDLNVPSGSVLLGGTNQIGNFNVNGGGVTVSNATSVTGGVTVTSGKLIVNASKANGPAFNVGGGLNVSGASTVNLAATSSSGPGTSIGSNVSLTGGTTTFNGASSLGGALSVSSGASAIFNAPSTVTGAITVSTSGSLAISAPFTGPSSGISVGNSGILSFNGANYHGGNIAVAGGAVSMTGSTNLNGAAINVAPPTNGANQLIESFYNGSDSTNSLTQGDPAFLPKQTPTSTRTLTTKLSFPDLTGHFASNINFRSSWSGYLFLNAGLNTFATASDDGSAIFLDLKHDGNYSDSGDEVLNNNAYQATTQKVNTVNIAAAGEYPIFIGFYQGGGGLSMEARFGAGTIASYTSIPVILSAPGQGFSSLPPGGGTVDVTGTSLSGAINGPTSITIEANSSLNVQSGGVTGVAGTTTFSVAAGGTVTSVGTLTNIKTLTLGAGSNFNLTTPSVASAVTTLSVPGANTTANLALAGSHNLTVTSLDVGAGNTLALTGGGGVTLAGNSDAGNTGTVNVTGSTFSAGTNALHGSLAGTVNGLSGGIVTGYGTIATLNLTPGSTVAPGPSAAATPGLNGTNIALTDAILALTFNSATSGSELHATNALTLNGSETLNFSLGYQPAQNDLFTILKEDTNAGFGPGQLTYGGKSLVNGTIFQAIGGSFNQYFQVEIASGAGSSTVALLAVPEPSTAPTLISGLAVIGGFRRWRRRSA